MNLMLRFYLAMITTFLLGCSPHRTVHHSVFTQGPAKYQDGTIDNAISLLCTSPNPKTLWIEHAGETHGPWTLPNARERLDIARDADNITVAHRGAAGAILANFELRMPTAVFGRSIIHSEPGYRYRVEIVTVDGTVHTNVLVLLLDCP